jgi:hypothetical protein
MRAVSGLRNRVCLAVFGHNLQVGGITAQPLRAPTVEDHNQLHTHLADFIAAYNFARRLKAIGGLTPYEYICTIWTSEPDRFILNPIHQMPGLNT